MSENLRRYTTIVFGFEHVLRLVPPGAWDNDSPCAGWTARDVAGHAMGVVHNVAARAGVGDVLDPFETPGAIAGDDPLTTFRGIRDRYLAATDRPGVLQTMVTSRLGEMTLDEYLRRMCGDTLIHTWDVARATGVEETLDPGSVAAVYADLVSGALELARGVGGRYADAVDGDGIVTEQDKMLAFTGRDPRRR